MEREEAEQGLLFAGFIVFKSRIIPDSQRALDTLHAAKYNLVMITGDHPLTSCYFARELHIVNKPVLIATAHGIPLNSYYGDR